MVATVPTNPGSARESWTRPTARVDWLAGPIAPEDAEGRDAEEAWLRAPVERCAPDTGFRGYDRWRGDSTGTKIARRRDLDRQGAVVGYSRTYLVLKGTGLAALRADGVDDREALRRFRLWSGRCSRLDLAIDVLHPEVTPLALHDRHQSRQFLTRLERPALFGDRDAGQTFYLFGKHQTFRAYDKSAERARKGVALDPGITRLEMEMRGPWARRAFRDLSKLLDAPDWDEAFPQFACGLILAKVRPLDAPRPQRNPQRAPIWAPLAEVLRDVRPVRLSVDELQRSAEQELAGQLLHFSNDLRGLALVSRIIGTGPFMQAIERQKLDGHGLALAALMQEDKPRLRAFLKEHGFDLDSPPPDGAEPSP